METSLFKADRILRQLFTIGERFPDCAIDVTGGSDAALFAAGMFAAKKGVPAFTYSRKKNRFYDISGAAFADDLHCDLLYSIEDFFLMAGGTLLPGRVDNHVLSRYLPDFDPFFDCFLRFRREWPNIISYIQRVSPSEYGQIPPLSIEGGYTVKGEHGTRNTANEEALRALERLDFIRALTIIPGERVSFRFRDLNTRAWLRDVGSAVELYAYKACVDSAIFHDIISSAVVRWDEVRGHGSVSYEIDVMAARGVIPLVLSCKACDIKTEALNELAILRDRFGGKGAKAAIRLLQNANQVSSVCNDVVGDICGIVSGSTAAVIVTHLQRDLSTTSVLISIGATALISGITIGGKALGKTVAINQCTSVVYRVSRILHALHLSR